MSDPRTRDCLACFWDTYKRQNTAATIHQLDPAEHPETWEVREGDRVLFGHLSGNPRVCRCAIWAKEAAR